MLSIEALAEIDMLFGRDSNNTYHWRKRKEHIAVKPEYQTFKD